MIPQEAFLRTRAFLKLMKIKRAQSRNSINEIKRSILKDLPYKEPYSKLKDKILEWMV